MRRRWLLRRARCRQVGQLPPRISLLLTGGFRRQDGQLRVIFFWSSPMTSALCLGRQAPTRSSGGLCLPCRQGWRGLSAVRGIDARIGIGCDLASPFLLRWRSATRSDGVLARAVAGDQWMLSITNLAPIQICSSTVLALAEGHRNGTGSVQRGQHRASGRCPCQWPCRSAVAVRPERRCSGQHRNAAG